MKINKVPKLHQREAIKFCLDRKRAIVCHKTGQGKTLTMLCIAFLQMEHYGINNSIIVGTNSALRSIVNELKNTFGEKPITWDEFRNGKKGIVTVAYQDLKKFLLDFPRGKFSLFLDEYHKVKSSKTQTTQLCNKLKLKCVYRYGFTATPIMKEIKDLFSLVKWMNPSILGSWENFCDTYTMYYKIPTTKGFDVLKPYRYRNYQKLKRILKDIIHSYFPPSNIEYVEKFIPLEDIKGYRKVREDSLMPTGDEQRDKALPMQAVKNCKHFVALSKGKFANLKSILDSVVTQYGAIVYCDEYYTLDPVYKFLLKCKYNVLKYTGKSSQKEKDASFNTFTTDAKGKVLLISRVGGASLNLQSTNQLIMVDMPSSIGAVQQLLGRTDRLDSEYDTFYMYLLLTENSVESYWYDYLKMFDEPLRLLFGNGDLPKGIPSYDDYLKKRLINAGVWNR